MRRLFVALSIPDEIAAGLQRLQSGVPGARWSKREQLHLTLRFIGEVDGRDATAIDDALSLISDPPFPLELHAVGTFGGRDPRELWGGVRASDALLHLQRKIETAIQRVGLPAETRKFTPHVTLARLKASPRGRVMDYLTDHALYASPPFEVREFLLYSSTLTSGGSIYTPEREYALG
jgi:RNA 2',3'-cyclic 3'-phosphodiesterase